MLVLPPLHSIQPRSGHCSRLAEAAAMPLKATPCRPAAMPHPVGQIQLREATPQWSHTPKGLGVVGCKRLAGWRIQCPGTKRQVSYNVHGPRYITVGCSCVAIGLDGALLLGCLLHRYVSRRCSHAGTALEQERRRLRCLNLRCWQHKHSRQDSAGSGGCSRGAAALALPAAP